MDQVTTNDDDDNEEEDSQENWGSVLKKRFQINKRSVRSYRRMTIKVSKIFTPTTANTTTKKDEGSKRDSLPSAESSPPQSSRFHLKANTLDNSTSSHHSLDGSMSGSSHSLRMPSFSWTEYDKKFEITRKKLTPARSLRTKKIRDDEGNGVSQSVDNLETPDKEKEASPTTTTTEHTSLKKKGPSKKSLSRLSDSKEVKDMDWKSMGISVLNMPLDDVYIKTVACPTELPDDIKQSGKSHPYIAEWIKTLTTDYKIVEYKYESFGNKPRATGVNLKEVESREKLGSFALSSSDKSVPNFKLDKIQDGSTKSEVEADTEPYIDPLPHVTITTEESKNAHTSKDLRDLRVDLFHAFPVPEKELNPGVIRKPDQLSDTQYKKPEHLLQLDHFKLDTVVYNEHLFFSFSLHNLKSCQKISEDFHAIFDTQNKIPLYLDQKVKPLFVLTDAKQYDIYLIIRVARMPKAINEKDYKLYVKGSTVGVGTVPPPPPLSSKKEPDSPKSDEIVDYSKPDAIVIPFLWAAIRLFDDTGKFLGAIKNPMSRENVKTPKDTEDGGYQTRSFQAELKIIKPSLSVTDESIYDCLHKDTEMKRFKVFNGKLSLEIKKLPYNFKGRRIDPSLFVTRVPESLSTSVGYPVHHKYNSPHSNSQRLQQFEEFLTEENDPQPNLTYVNNLYIYPISITVKHTELLQIKVQLKRNDSTKDSEKNIYERYKKEFTDVIYTHSYIAKNPNLYDEIKIKLPVDLNADYHVLFTFNDVTLKKGSKSQVIAVLGYSVLKLYSDEKIVEDEEYKLAISKGEFPETGYLNNTKWSKQNAFIIRTKLKSSIYPQDQSVNKYLVEYCRPNTGIEAINNLQRVTIKFLPVIFNTLFQVLCDGEDTQAATAFKAIISLLKGLDNPGTHSILNYYATYLFDNTTKPAFEQITKYWLNADAELMDGFKTYWFLFSIITKSMVLHLAKVGKLKSKKKHEQFSASFQTNLETLLPKLLQFAGATSVITFPVFIISLFGLLSTGTVFKLIFTLMCAADNHESTKALKFTWLKIICDYQHFVPLNLPTDMEVESLNISELRNTLWTRHFLVGELINEIDGCIQDSTLRDQGITVLRNILRKHEFDVRYQHKEVRATVATIYLPFLLLLAEYAGLIQDSKAVNSPEASKWALCFLYVLKHIKKTVLVHWWNKDTQKTLENFLDFLFFTLESFMDKNEILECNFIVLDVLILFVTNFQDLLCKEEHPFMTKIIKILKHLLGSPYEIFICALYRAIAEFISKLKKCLFLFKTTTYCQDLTYEILHHCNSTSRPVRNRAGMTFYLLMKANFAERQSLSRTAIQSILAVSKVIGSDLSKSYNLLHNSLAAIRKYHANDSEMQFNQAFAKELDEVLNRLIDITKQNKRIAQNWIDEEMTADIYMEIASEAVDSPDLRFTWLENLALFHVQNGNIEEAAQCKLHIAYLICQYLQLTNPKSLPKELRFPNSELFTKVAPSILKEARLTARNEDEAMFQQPVWNLAGLIKVFNETVLLLERARRYEHCIEIFHLMALIYKHDKNYAELIGWSQRYKNICDNLVKMTKEGKEVFSRYYRVTFYGKKWLEDFDQRVYIYKKKYRNTIGEIATGLMKTFSHKLDLPKEDIISLPNKEIDIDSLDPNKVYFQIVSVQPYFEPEELADRSSLFEQNFNLSTFISEIPMAKDGGKLSEDDPSRLCKKKTIFRCQHAFPYISNRIPVMSSEEIMLSPIECAIESLQQRINQFRTEVFCSTIRKNNLQALLTGTLAPTVHVGPMKFAEVFLSAQANYEPALQEKLREAMAELLLMSEMAVKMNRGIIGPEQLPFQKMLEQKFNEVLKMFQEKYGGGLSWNKVAQGIHEKEQKARASNNSQEKKLSKS